MKKSNSVFIVSWGEYSDYHICAVFDSRKMAELYVEATKTENEEPQIEEHPLNPDKKYLKEGYRFFFVRMDKDGCNANADSAGDSFSVINDPHFYSKYEMINEEHPTMRCKYKKQLFFDNFGITVSAKDKQHAIKIANEKRIQLLAMDKWPEDHIEELNEEAFWKGEYVWEKSKDNNFSRKNRSF